MALGCREMTSDPGHFPKLQAGAGAGAGIPIHLQYLYLLVPRLRPLHDTCSFFIPPALPSRVTGHVSQPRSSSTLIVKS